LTRDASDFDELLRRHAPVAFRRARLMLGVDADAHAAVHEVFAPLRGHPERYRDTPRLTTSLYSAVTHECLNLLADPPVRARLVQANTRPRPSTRDAQRNESSLRALLFRTPETLAEIGVYYYLDELTTDEIVRVLEMPRVQVDELLGRLSLLERTRLEACPSDLILDSYAAEELAPNVAAQVEKHLGHCEICQGRRAAFNKARAEFLLMAPTFEAQQKHIEHEQPQPLPKSPPKATPSQALKAGGAAVFALLALALVVVTTLEPCTASTPTGGAKPKSTQSPPSPPPAAPVR
jgi:DNA-directed RNA polymerase specialized sigma24 family protein